MRIYRFIIALAIILTGSGVLHAQQNATDAERLKGEWQIEKVVVKTFAQQGNKLLEEKTYSVVDSMIRINGFVPLGIQFRDLDCIITHRGGQEGGKYSIPANGILDYQHSIPSAQSQKEEVFEYEYTYQLPQPDRLVISMPAAFYKDNVRNLPVKLVYTCYYQKKL
ncbi:hypothetical protein [Chitinophaga sp. GbtcB8]|uniref:hypothetical protein n=1 Tax=Chitinophaga sp. GbtcB8 TaxID=2824753 RepID=UPI001C2F6ABC|nr:hypothetical protein [Chitinophaga sp. GbtcB8]